MRGCLLVSVLFFLCWSELDFSFIIILLVRCLVMLLFGLVRFDFVCLVVCWWLSSLVIVMGFIWLKLFVIDVC